MVKINFIKQFDLSDLIFEHHASNCSLLMWNTYLCSNPISILPKAVDQSLTTYVLYNQDRSPEHHRTSKLQEFSRDRKFFLPALKIVPDLALGHKI